MLDEEESRRWFRSASRTLESARIDHAHGFYNEWSDIDVLIITNFRKIPQKPVNRFEILYDCIRSNLRVEPVIVTYEEFIKPLEKKNLLIIEAVERGVTLIDRLT